MIDAGAWQRAKYPVRGDEEDPGDGDVTQDPALIYFATSYSTKPLWPVSTTVTAPLHFTTLGLSTGCSFSLSFPCFIHQTFPFKRTQLRLAICEVLADFVEQAGWLPSLCLRGSPSLLPQPCTPVLMIFLCVCSCPWTVAFWRRGNVSVPSSCPAQVRHRVDTCWMFDYLSITRRWLSNWISVFLHVESLENIFKKTKNNNSIP